MPSQRFGLLADQDLLGLEIEHVAGFALDLLLSLEGGLGYQVLQRSTAFSLVARWNNYTRRGQAPGTSTLFQELTQAMYGAAYTLKFMIKLGPAGIDYGVMPLEGLWWADDMTDFGTGSKDNWQWTAMIMQPEFVTGELFEQAVEKAQKKSLPALAKIRLEEFAEGLAAQTMHVGPYSAEGPTIQRIHKFISDSGRELAGKHHEIYLSDPRRASPDKMMTVVRQPAGPVMSDA